MNNGRFRYMNKCNICKIRDEVESEMCEVCMEDVNYAGNLHDSLCNAYDLLRNL